MHLMIVLSAKENQRVIKEEYSLTRWQSRKVKSTGRVPFFCSSSPSGPPMVECAIWLLTFVLVGSSTSAWVIEWPEVVTCFQSNGHPLGLQLGVIILKRCGQVGTQHNMSESSMNWTVQWWFYLTGELDGSVNVLINSTMVTQPHWTDPFESLSYRRRSVICVWPLMGRDTRFCTFHSLYFTQWILCQLLGQRVTQIRDQRGLGLVNDVLTVSE